MLSHTSTFTRILEEFIRLMFPSLVLRTFAETSYLFLVLLLIVATGLSCAALLAQAVRTSPTQSWIGNYNALVIGASYLLVVR